MLVPHLRHKIDHNIRRIGKGINIEDLRSHVAVQSVQNQILLCQGGAYDCLRLSGHDGGSKLGVHVARDDLFVGVRIDAGGNPQKDFLANTRLAGNAVQCVKLLVGVHHDMTRAQGYCIAQIRIGFIVAVEINPVHRESRGVGGVQFTGGNAVCAHIFLGHNAVHPLEAKGLARIYGGGFAAKAFRKGGFVHPAHRADMILIQHVQRSAVFLCQSQCIDTADGQVSLGVDAVARVKHGRCLSLILQIAVVRDLVPQFLPTGAVLGGIKNDAFRLRQVRISTQGFHTFLLFGGVQLIAFGGHDNMRNRSQPQIAEHIPVVGGGANPAVHQLDHQTEQIDVGVVGEIPVRQGGPLLLIGLGALGVAVAGQVHQEQLVVHVVEVDSNGFTGSAADPRQRFSLEQGIDQRAFSHVGSAGEGDLRDRISGKLAGQTGGNFQS